MVIGGERVESGTTFETVMPHATAHVLADVETRRRRARRARDRRGARRTSRLVADTVARARRGLPPCRRARSPGRGARRSTRPRCSTSRRRRTRPRSTPSCETIDFLRFNVEYLDADLQRAADPLAGRLEPARVPPAGGVRLRGQPVQLHGDRRESDHLSGADGQHGRVEAGLDPGAVGLVHAARCSRRPACRRA